MWESETQAPMEGVAEHQVRRQAWLIVGLVVVLLVVPARHRRNRRPSPLVPVLWSPDTGQRGPRGGLRARSLGSSHGWGVSRKSKTVEQGG